jgi:hypothetical protein
MSNPSDDMGGDVVIGGDARIWGGSGAEPPATCDGGIISKGTVTDEGVNSMSGG